MMFDLYKTKESYEVEFYRVTDTVYGTYAGRITVEARLQQIKIVAIEKAPSWGSVLQSSLS